MGSHMGAVLKFAISKSICRSDLAAARLIAVDARAHAA